MKIVVLGCGRVGSAIARDLAADRNFAITVADASDKSLSRLSGHPEIATLQADLSEPAGIARAVEGQDLVVGAMPGDYGFATVKTVLELGKNIVDISFFNDDPFKLDALAREKGLIAVVDCGVAPGLDNMLLGRATVEMDHVDRFVCSVGGLPVVRTWPFEYSAVFSPSDVIEEYKRPARLVENGEEVVRPALSGLERVDLPGVGTLESFNTDGLRSLVTTMKVRDMAERTLRYPGHAELMRMLRDTGFFSTDEVEVGDVRVRPLDLTSKLIFDAWQLKEGEEDITVMRVEIEGRKDGKRLRTVYDILDRFDRQTGTTSMARTTGYTCTAVTRLVARGAYNRIGMSPPEYVGLEVDCCKAVLEDLAARNIILRESTG